MRLRRLWLENFYNLNEVEIEFRDAPFFEESTNITFFVGLNGSGKSSAMEAIGLIFSHLSSDTRPGFNYDLEYEVGGRIIRITTRLDNVAKKRLHPIGAAVLTRASEESQWEAMQAWSSSHKDLPFPERIVGYSTGPTSGLQWALSRSIERLVKHELGQFEYTDKPTGMTREDWERFLKDRYEDAKRREERYLDNPKTLFLGSEDALCSVLPLLVYEETNESDQEAYQLAREMILNRVDLDSNLPLPAFSLLIAGDWNKQLSVSRKDSMESLLKLVSVITPTDRDWNEEQITDEVPPADLYAVFDLDANLRKKIRKLFPSPLSFFEELLAWKRQRGLKHVRMVLRKQKIKNLLPDTALSDGEFLLLGRYAMILMLRGLDETLVLLDEPETHFNDQWKVDLVKDLHTLLDRGNGDREAKSSHQVIISTHSAITVSDANPYQVIVFRRDDASVHTSLPRIRTFAADISAISEELANLDSAVGRYAEQKVADYIRNYKEDPDKLREILGIVGPGALKLEILEAIRRATRHADRD